MAEERLTESLQENLLTLIAVDDENCKLVKAMVPVDLFSSFLYRDIVTQCYQYIGEFGKAPKDHLPDLLEEQLKGDSDKSKLFKSTLGSIAQLAESLNTKYVMSRLHEFVRGQQIKVSVVLASEAVTKGDLDLAERHLYSALKQRAMSFDSPISVLQGFDILQRQDLNKERVLLGIPEMDHRDAGPARGEYALYIAPPKSGKTWYMIHIAKRAALQRLRVLYITLEVSDLIMAQRLVQSFLGVSKRQGQILVPDFRLDEDKRLANIVREEIAGSRLSFDQPGDMKAMRKKLLKLSRTLDYIRIKQFPTGQLTIGQLNAYLDGLENAEGFVPDVLVLDYPDLMKIDPKNIRAELGALGKDIRGVMVERNLIGQGASQVNRESTSKKVIEGTGVAEDYSKIAISDSVISYNQTRAERRAGTARLNVVASRNDEDKYETVIAQCYAIGQYALSSVRPGMQYHSLITTKFDEDGEDEEDGGEA